MLVNQVFTDEKAPVAALLTAFIKVYGVEALQWEPEIIRAEIEEDFGIELNDLQANKLHAGITMITTDRFEQDYQTFETCVNLINNQDDDFDTVNVPEAEDIVRAVGEYSLINHDQPNFNGEVSRYAGLIFYEFGYCQAPKLFPTALLPECNKCDVEQKEEALAEAFDAHVSYVADYLEKLK